MDVTNSLLLVSSIKFRLHLLEKQVSFHKSETVCSILGMTSTLVFIWCSLVRKYQWRTEKQSIYLSP